MAALMLQRPRSTYHILAAVLQLSFFAHGTPLDRGIARYEPVHLNQSDLLRQHQRSRRSLDNPIQFNFKAFDKHFQIVLTDQSNILSPDISVETSKGTLNYDQSRHYHGYDASDSSSIVHGIITSIGTFSGQIYHVDETYSIEDAIQYFPEIQKFSSIIYRASDIITNRSDFMCTSQLLRQQKNQPKYMYVDDELRFKQRYRQRRAIVPDKTVCELYVQADHRYFQQFQSDEEQVVAQIVNHVTTVDAIFRKVDFDGDGSADSISFIIKRLKIHDDPNAADYKFADKYSVEKFLDVHSSDNYDAFCLSIMFTNEDFNNGVLGLAWTAGANQAGGVCEKYSSFSGEWKSLNSAIVTTRNYGTDVSTLVTHATLAHEIGHNFGAGHDDVDDPVCAPAGTEGNFIMFPQATSGLKPNNKLFSSCSITSMASILADKARSSDGCFTVQKSSICGNKVVEDTEECDCGWEGECDEQCCHPETTTQGPNTPCTLKTGMTCSPSQGLCCSSTCQLYTALDSHVCRANTSCTSAAKCDGSSVTCPNSQPEANGTSCDQDLVCFMGQCTGSPCLSAGLEPCQCPAKNTGDYSDVNLCKVCCLSNNVCTLSTDLNNVPDSKVQPGTPCNNFKGYCDTFYVCREVDPSGPLSNLQKLIFGGEIISTIKTFLTKHWYVGVAAGVALFILIGIVVKCCSKSHGLRENKVTDIGSERFVRKSHQSRF